MERSRHIPLTRPLSAVWSLCVLCATRRTRVSTDRCALRGGARAPWPVLGSSARAARAKPCRAKHITRAFRFTVFQRSRFGVSQWTNRYTYIQHISRLPLTLVSCNLYHIDLERGFSGLSLARSRFSSLVTSLCLSIALSVQRVCHLVICLVCVALLISTWRSDGTKTRRLKRLN